MKTAPYPDNPRSEWVVTYRVQPQLQADGLVHFEYEVYASAQSRDRGDLPFFINSHRSMIREAHQMMVQPAPGFFRHISGIDVPFADLTDFLTTDSAYRWAKTSLTEWEDDRQRKLAPFVFPTYWGVPEALDPQWERQLFTVPVGTQVLELVARKLARVELLRMSGDHRGSTLDLQVGASADDGTAYPSFDATATWFDWGYQSGSKNEGFARWTGASAIQGATVNADTYFDVYMPSAETGVPDVAVYCADEASPAAPTTQGEYDTDVAGQTSNKADFDAQTIIANDWYQITSGVQALIQELVDGHGSLSVILALFEDEKGTGPNVYSIRTYDGSTTLAPKIHIDYDTSQFVTPAPITAASAIQAPSVAGTGSAPVTPSPVTAPSAVEAPSISGTGSASPVTPAPVAAPSAIQAPVLSGSGSAPVTPAPIVAVSAIQAPVISATGSAPVTPDPIAAVSVVVAPVITRAGQEVSPAPIVATSAIQAPSIAGTGSAPVTPDPIPAVSVVVAPVVSNVIPPPPPSAGKPRYGQPIVVEAAPAHRTQPVDFTTGFIELVRTTGPTYGAPRVRNIRTYGSRRLENVTA